LYAFCQIDINNTAEQAGTRRRINVKPNKKASVERKKVINATKPARPAKGQDSRKVHETKGKNTHGRNF
jgi:hypothetical protein